MRGSNSRSRANLKPFKPGESGNPGGLPRGTPRLSTAYQKLLGVDARSRLPVETIADEIAASVIKRAINGDLRAAQEVADRTEGTATPFLSVPDGDAIELELLERERVVVTKIVQQLLNKGWTLSLALEHLEQLNIPREKLKLVRCED